jgi:hypothetical protein
MGDPDIRERTLPKTPKAATLAPHPTRIGGNVGSDEGSSKPTGADEFPATGKRCRGDHAPEVMFVGREATAARPTGSIGTGRIF